MAGPSWAGKWVGVDRWWLLVATVLAAAGGGVGWRAVARGRRSAAAVWWLAGALGCQFVFLWLRGTARGACPLGDAGESLAFAAWSLTLFYLLVGRAYRWSPVGVITAPVVVAIQLAALLPGVLTAAPAPVAAGAGAWGEGHAATSVLSYGALGLAAVTAAVFLVLDRQLKGRRLRSRWFRAMPPAHELLVALARLLRLGAVVMTIGIMCGWMAMRHGPGGAPAHLAAALAVWVAYLALLVVERVRGLAGRWLAWAAIVLFAGSFVVFAFI